jgi:RNA polymerase sigma factor (sigma-70 family)
MAIRAAMERLNEDQRLAIGLVLVEGMSYKEAADVLEIPMGTLTSRLARAREQLQMLLADAARQTGTGQ